MNKNYKQEIKKLEKERKWEDIEVYESEINAYNQKISKYSEEIRNMNLSDIQIFMKVMDDMWHNIKGYADPEKDIIGYLELSIATEEGYGVCRNMASDVAKKLNEINPNWNARIMCVLVPEEMENLPIADIKRKNANKDEIIEENKSNKNIQNEKIIDLIQNSSEENKTTVIDLAEEKIIDFSESISGNHMVTLVDIDEDNITLVLDPTNPGLGIYKNGNIIMFNSNDGQDIEYKAKEYITATMFKGGLNGINSTIEEYAQSFAKPKITMKELKAKYGLEAQNKALKEVRKKCENKTNMIYSPKNLDRLVQETKEKLSENFYESQNIMENREEEER